MFSEQKSKMASPFEDPSYNDVFIDALTQRLVPLIQVIAQRRARLIGMSLTLSIVSLIALTTITYLFLSLGAASISVGVMHVGNSLDAAQKLLGIGITSLAIVLINAVFGVIILREKR